MRRDHYESLPASLKKVKLICLSMLVFAFMISGSVGASDSAKGSEAKTQRVDASQTESLERSYRRLLPLAIPLAWEARSSEACCSDREP